MSRGNNQRMRWLAIVVGLLVATTAPYGGWSANRLDIFDSGDVVRFHGGVVMDMKLNQPPSQEKSDNQ